MTITPIDVTVLEGYECLEPEVGIKLLPRYPDLLSASERARFELHLEACAFCRERLKVRRALGMTVVRLAQGRRRLRRG